MYILIKYCALALTMLNTINLQAQFSRRVLVIDTLITNGVDFQIYSWDYYINQNKDDSTLIFAPLDSMQLNIQNDKYPNFICPIMVLDTFMVAKLTLDNNMGFLEMKFTDINTCDTIRIDRYEVLNCYMHDTLSVTYSSWLENDSGKIESSIRNHYSKKCLKRKNKQALLNDFALTINGVKYYCRVTLTSFPMEFMSYQGVERGVLAFFRKRKRQFGGAKIVYKTMNKVELFLECSK